MLVIPAQKYDSMPVELTNIERFAALPLMTRHTEPTYANLIV